MDFLLRVYGWFWSFLPDRCEQPGCSRMGIRGNENIVDGTIMCDYCHAAHLEQISLLKSIRALLL